MNRGGQGSREWGGWDYAKLGGLALGAGLGYTKLIRPGMIKASQFKKGVNNLYEQGSKELAMRRDHAAKIDMLMKKAGGLEGKGQRRAIKRWQKAHHRANDPVKPSFVSRLRDKHALRKLQKVEDSVPSIINSKYVNPRDWSGHRFKSVQNQIRNRQHAINKARSSISTNRHSRRAAKMRQQANSMKRELKSNKPLNPQWTPYSKKIESAKEAGKWASGKVLDSKNWSLDQAKSVYNNLGKDAQAAGLGMAMGGKTTSGLHQATSEMFAKRGVGIAKYGFDNDIPFLRDMGRNMVKMSANTPGKNWSRLGAMGVGGVGALGAADFLNPWGFMSISD